MGLSYEEILEIQSQKGGNTAPDNVVPDIPKVRPKDEVKPSEEPPATTEDVAIEKSQTDVTTEVYDTSKKMTAQHTGTSSRSAKAHAGRKASEKASIRDFPTNLLAIAKSEFPSAQNQTDALAAYVYVKSGKNVAISDSIRELVDDWEGDHTVANIEKRVTSLENSVREIKKMLESLNLLMAYVAFDRLGYRNEQARSPRDVNLLENGVEDLMKRVDEQADTKRKHDAVQNGRPIR
jgi:hypothetical protein